MLLLTIPIIGSDRYHLRDLQLELKQSGFEFEYAQAGEWYARIVSFGNVDENERNKIASKLKKLETRKTFNAPIMRLALVQNGEGQVSRLVVRLGRNEKFNDVIEEISKCFPNIDRNEMERQSDTTHCTIARPLKPTKPAELRSLDLLGTDLLKEYEYKISVGHLVLVETNDLKVFKEIASYPLMQKP